MSDTEALLEVRDLSVRYARGRFGRSRGARTETAARGVHESGDSRGRAGFYALRSVSFDLAQGETLAVVGESGCGKSTLARALLRLVPAAGGSVLFRPVPGAEPLRWLDLRGARLRRERRHMQIVFQDPGASLHPRMSVREIVGEPLLLRRAAPRRLLTARVGELLERVGLEPAAMERLPHELSGGGRQRIAIARALASEPEFIVCDEILSALDRSIQAQILTLLREQQEERGVAYLFITHDLSVVPWVAYRVAVMYLGRIVEYGLGQTLFASPAHPYTRALLAARGGLEPKRGAPVADSDVAAPAMRGEVPPAWRVPTGCAFHPRCPLAEERCRNEPPELRTVAEREVACHFAEKVVAPEVSGAES